MRSSVLLWMLCAVGTVLCLAGLWRKADDSRVWERVPDYNWSEVNGIFAQQRELEGRVERLRRYRSRNAEVLEELKAKKMTLRHAATVTAAIAGEVYPELLRMLGQRYPHLASDEQAALWLMGQLDGEVSTGGMKMADACQVECLRDELKEWSVLVPQQPKRQ